MASFVLLANATCNCLPFRSRTCTSPSPIGRVCGSARLPPSFVRRRPCLLACAVSLFSILCSSSKRFEISQAVCDRKCRTRLTDHDKAQPKPKRKRASKPERKSAYVTIANKREHNPTDPTDLYKIKARHQLCVSIKLVCHCTTSSEQR